MWAEHDAYKNHFLQKQLKHLKPSSINESVSKEINKRQIRRGACNTLKAHSGECKSDRYFEDRSQLAYGFWALPKILKEMGSDNAEIQFRAINTLSEYMTNPFHAQQAIIKYQIVRRCQNVFLRIRMKYQKSKFRVTDRLITIFYLAAHYYNGAQSVGTKNRLMDQFYIIVRDREEYMLKTSKVLALVTQQAELANYLVKEFNVYKKLAEIWSRDVCMLYYPDDLWLHLQHIITLYPSEAVEHGFFEILHTRIKGRLFQYHRFDLKCFALLLRCDEGRKRFQAVDGAKEMYDIFKNEKIKLNTYENVVFTLLTGVVAKQVLWRCREFTDLPKIITQLAMDSKQQNMQLLCLQLLRQLGVMPCIKRYIQENCLDLIKSMECIADFNKRELNELTYWLQREIYHTSDLKVNKK